MYIKNKFKRAFSLIEIVVSVFIVSLILVAVGSFQRDVFYLNDVIQIGLTTQNDARKIIRPMVDEVRSASESSLGAYPLATTASSTFIFYSDIDNDSLKERVRYFLDNGDFKKGVLKPSGNPLTYNTSDEKITEVVNDIINTEIFTYFNSSYDGTASSTALVQPVSPLDVRLIKIQLVVDKDPSRAPAQISVGTQVSIRNLKDNYED